MDQREDQTAVHADSASSAQPLADRAASTHVTGRIDSGMDTPASAVDWQGTYDEWRAADYWHRTLGGVG
jgi:hypothetical protein